MKKNLNMILAASLLCVGSIELVASRKDFKAPDTFSKNESTSQNSQIINAIKVTEIEQNQEKQNTPNTIPDDYVVVNNNENLTSPTNSLDFNTENSSDLPFTGENSEGIDYTPETNKSEAEKQLQLQKQLRQQKETERQQKITAKITAIEQANPDITLTNKQILILL